MSALLHTKGNLLDLAEAGKFTFIVHGCNCKNVFGAGIAKEIKERFPGAYAADTEYYNSTSVSANMLGNFSYEMTDSVLIINAYTQYGTASYKGEDVFEYAAFEVILRKLALTLPRGSTVGLPYIGMGLAGGDKDRIIAMIENFADELAKNNSTVTLVEFDPTA